MFAVTKKGKNLFSKLIFSKPIQFKIAFLKTGAEMTGNL